MPTAANGHLRVAALADIHFNKNNQGTLHPIFTQVAESADVLLMGGDLTDTGLVEEAQALAKELTATVKIPVIGVLGNHDYESGHQKEIKQILCDAGISILDGETCDVRGVGFAGIKGFCGGFGKFALPPWGEDIVKHFVQETVEDALRLESALSRLEDMPRIVLMHYSPIRATVEGEPIEIFAFLGSSRLEEPVNRFDVTAVFHGHAHAGSPEGRTIANVPVYNVSLPVLRKTYPDRSPFRMLEIPLTAPVQVPSDLSHSLIP